MRAILVGIAGLSLLGCSLESVKQRAKELIDEELPKLKQAARDTAAKVAEEKIKESQKKHLAVLEANLRTLIEKGGEKKTLKDFDEDGDGEYNNSELLKASTFVATETARLKLEGKLSEEEAGRIAKTSGGAVAALALLMLLLRGARKLKKNGGEEKKTAAK